MTPAPLSRQRLSIKALGAKGWTQKQSASTLRPWVSDAGRGSTGNAVMARRVIRQALDRVAPMVGYAAAEAVA